MSLREERSHEENGTGISGGAGAKGNCKEGGAMEGAPPPFPPFASPFHSLGFEAPKGGKGKIRSPAPNSNPLPSGSVGGSRQVDEKFRLFFLPPLPAV